MFFCSIIYFFFKKSFYIIVAGLQQHWYSRILVISALRALLPFKKSTGSSRRELESQLHWFQNCQEAEENPAVIVMLTATGPAARTGHGPANPRTLQRPLSARSVLIESLERTWRNDAKTTNPRVWENVVRGRATPAAPRPALCPSCHRHLCQRSGRTRKMLIITDIIQLGLVLKTSNIALPSRKPIWPQTSLQ